MIYLKVKTSPAAGWSGFSLLTTSIPAGMAREVRLCIIEMLLVSLTLTMLFCFQMSLGLLGVQIGKGSCLSECLRDICASC